MKKLILGLLLIFSFSYGVEENLYLTKDIDIIKSTQKYAFEIYAMHPTKAKQIIKEVLNSYEFNYGSESLLMVSICFGNTALKLLSNVSECKSTIAHTMAFSYFIEQYHDYSKKTILQVTSAFGISLGMLFDDEFKQQENSNGKKKRI